MSGECDTCGEHCLDCKCDCIKVWAQMFFDDGSVTQGIRVNCQMMEQSSENMKAIAKRLLASVNRDEGLLVVWGAGDIMVQYYIISSSQA